MNGVALIPHQAVSLAQDQFPGTELTFLHFPLPAHNSVLPDFVPGNRIKRFQNIIPVGDINQYPAARTEESAGLPDNHDIRVILADIAEGVPKNADTVKLVRPETGSPGISPDDLNWNTVLNPMLPSFPEQAF